ncbi:hypothetical protein [Cellulosilyticum sp. I15G10I2]|uniref:hypothetical protein n=1 Tax=Cellulosilyticum sp. I15G10I2 TaxID=1892843 RepID=UPI001495ED08|nr:hypothetical protein [Cellulosilyticum sp. I15G10I2]
MIIVIYIMPIIGFLFFINFIAIMENIHANKEAGWGAFWGALMFAYMVWGFTWISIM